MSDRFVNLTRSTLTVVNDKGERTVLPPSGKYATVRKIVRSIYTEGGVPVSEVEYEIEGMPDSDGEHLWVVSWKTLMTMKALGYDVTDVYAPDMFIRDKSGTVTGARVLSTVR